MVLSAGIASLAEKNGEKHYSMKNAWKIFLRDRKSTAVRILPRRKLRAPVH